MSDNYKFKMGTFESDAPETVIKRITNFIKTVVGTGISSTVRNIVLLRAFIQTTAL